VLYVPSPSLYSWIYSFDHSAAGERRKRRLRKKEEEEATERA